MACGGGRPLFDKQCLPPRSLTHRYHPHFIMCGSDHSANGGNTRTGQIALFAQGFRRTKICSLPRFGSSVLRRRISFSTSGYQCFFVVPKVPYCAGLAPQVLPCSVTDATSKACGRTRQKLQKPQKYRVYPRSAEPSFSLLLYQPSLKASTHNRPFGCT